MRYKAFQFQVFYQIVIIIYKGTPKMLTITLFAVSLAFQVINLAAQGLAAKTYKDADDLGSTTSNVDTNQGYFVFVLAASSLSILCYIYLLIVKISDKSPSMIVDFVVWILVLVLQFAMASVLAVNARNSSASYDASMLLLSGYEAAGAEGSMVDVLRNYQTVHNLSIAAIVLDYFFNFGCGLILLASNANNVLQSPQNNPQRAKDQSTLPQITQ